MAHAAVLQQVICSALGACWLTDWQVHAACSLTQLQHASRRPRINAELRLMTATFVLVQDSKLRFSDNLISVLICA